MIEARLENVPNTTCAVQRWYGGGGARGLRPIFLVRLERPRILGYKIRGGNNHGAQGNFTSLCGRVGGNSAQQPGISSECRI